MLTATISVSRQNLNCENVVKTLADMGVACSVTSNTSLVKHRKGSVVRENGCRIVIGGVRQKSDLEEVWKKLQSDHGFTCAHATVQGAHSGCVFDVFGTTRCPG